jgi:hypothetical protein
LDFGDDTRLNIKGTFKVYGPSPSKLNKIFNLLLRGNKNCELISDKTMVLGFCDYVAAGFNDVQNAGVPQAKGTNGVACNVASTAYIKATLGTVTVGIVVGRGVASAIAIDTYALDTLITHGNGANQLSYGDQSYVVPTTSGNSRVFVITRTFTNGSGADITITNMGILCYVAAMGNSVLVDKTNHDIVVPNGGNKTITYTLTVTV